MSSPPPPPSSSLFWRFFIVVSMVICWALVGLSLWDIWGYEAEVARVDAYVASFPPGTITCGTGLFVPTPSSPTLAVSAGSVSVGLGALFGVVSGMFYAGDEGWRARGRTGLTRGAGFMLAGLPAVLPLGWMVIG